MIDQSGGRQGSLNETAAIGEMERILLEQRDAFRRLGPPTLAQRLDRLDRAILLLKDFSEEICAAAAQDFGNRSPHQTLVADVYTVIASLKFAKANLKRWIRPEQRPLQLPWGLLGARGEVRFEPLGVVGVVSPWNFPVSLAFTPLAGIFAAGNSVMIRPSEVAPASAALIAHMIQKGFDRTEAYVVQGGPKIAEAFTRLPLDHLLFTGSTRLGSDVLRAAADHLVPVTLELGGKSPVILSPSADFEPSVARILFGKTLNAGQVCLAPDYVFVPEGQVDRFADAAGRAVAAMFPTLKENPDYTSIINARHHARLQALLAEARERGAQIVELNPAGESFAQQSAYRMPPTLILNPPDDLAVMQEEIFGPILPVKSYSTLDEALAFIASKPKPLALYYFGRNEKEIARVLARSSSGGVTINDIAQHVAHESLPFGGVGASGMGRYHGIDGFRTFSNARTVFRQTNSEILKVMRAPYSAGTLKLLKRLIGK